ncbi:MAG: fatty acid cis/trans isomerase, partial [Proteobacteria bacterium]|nr:fatty acid cis/trans isomerase [Pseudomonadota bacterium]
AWLAAGAKGPDPETDRLMKSPSNGTTGEEVINRWEKFLNEATPKMITTARYLYEHLFLAHIHFDEIPGDYFLLVRSRTPWPAPIDEIPTVKPYDDPGVPQFYYRFQKIHSTIVFKTHILYRLNDTRMDRYRKLFLDSEWQNNEIIVPSYEPDSSANPFRTFQQIPARSRYQFLLDDSQYFFMSFIRGPVCTGQLALNVINDHFWVIFLDPDADLSLADPQYLNANIDYLKLPTEARGRYDRLFYVPYLFARNRYILNRTALYKAKYPNGLGLEDVWAGDDSESNPFLTIYRHFDSATVSTGPVGGFPRTGWVIDFPLFERLYYNLVAGFNVFSNIKEQVGGRNYMDLQRKEAELLLLNFMPPESRAEILKSWYPTFFSRLFVLDDMVMLDAETPTQVLFPGNNTDPMQYKNTFFTQIIDQRLRKDIGYQYDPLNFHADQLDRTPAKVIATEQDLDDEFRKISHLAGTFVRAMPDKGDVAFVRFVRENREDLVYTVILNRYHENVAFIKGEDLRLDEAKNTIHVVKGFVGSYPNAFFKVNFEEAPEFFKMFRAAHDTPESFLHFFEKFGIKRSAPDFWEMSDFFNDRFMKDRPLEAGYFDLNRYINDPQPPSFWDRLLFTLRKEYQTGEALPADCPAGF